MLSDGAHQRRSNNLGIREKYDREIAIIKVGVQIRAEFDEDPLVRRAQKPVGRPKARGDELVEDQQHKEQKAAKVVTEPAALKPGVENCPRSRPCEQRRAQ